MRYEQLISLLNISWRSKLGEKTLLHHLHYQYIRFHCTFPLFKRSPTIFKALFCVKFSLRDLKTARELDVTEHRLQKYCLKSSTLSYLKKLSPSLIFF